MSQADVARAINGASKGKIKPSQGSLSDWEAGRIVPRFNAVYWWMRVLGCETRVAIGAFVLELKRLIDNPDKKRGHFKKPDDITPAERDRIALNQWPVTDGLDPDIEAEGAKEEESCQPID